MTTAHDLELGLDRLAEDIAAIAGAEREPLLWRRFARHARELARVADTVGDSKDAALSGAFAPTRTLDTQPLMVGPDGRVYALDPGHPGELIETASEGELREMYGR